MNKALLLLVFYIFYLVNLTADGKVKIEQINNLQGVSVDQDKIHQLSAALNMAMDWWKAHKTLLGQEYSIRGPKSTWVRLNPVKNDNGLFPISYQEKFENERTCWYAAPQITRPRNRWRISLVLR
jgi:hypothetical protein